MSEIQHFPKISYVSANFRCEIRFDRFSGQFARAQWWFGEQVLQGCRAVMPMQTGGLQQRSSTSHMSDRSSVENGGRQVVFPGPYARFQYGGKVMVDPDTGSPWARKNAVKVLTDRPLTYSNPEATDHWFDEAKARNGAAWIAGVKKIAGGG